MKLLEPFHYKNFHFKNRVVMPPMCTYQLFKEDGKITDFHISHYTMRAIGQVGLIIVESTAINKKGMLSPYDLGIWSNTHIKGLKRLVDSVHFHDSLIGIQINHAGRKSNIQPNISASPISYSEWKEKPKALTIKEINNLIKEYGQAARRANKAGFDLLEIHAAHGYLINQFISPLSNKREDEFSDPFLFLKLVIKEVGKYWPVDKLLSIRISIDDLIEGGISFDEYIDFFTKYKPDFVNISTGGILPVVKDEYVGYQMEYARRFKEATGIKVLAGGLLTISNAEKELDKFDYDLIYLGRTLLRKPLALLNETDIPWPKVYVRANIDLEKNKN